MLIKPKIKEFICLTSDPDGCKRNIEEQISYIQKSGKANGPQNILVIGASSGYGLATRIAATYACGSATIGVMFERPESDTKMGTSGWYNSRAFEDRAHADGYYAKTINGDAFSTQVKEDVISLIKEDLIKIDMIIYSLAASKRTLEDGSTFHSSLKTIGKEYRSKNLMLKNNSVSEISITPATQEEVESTIKVMGGEDWANWINALSTAKVLSESAITIAYSYIGPKITNPIYSKGTIGYAKQHLYETAAELNMQYKTKGLKAYISMNKAIVTQASSAIPVVPLYLTILYKIMKTKNIHEGCIEQMARLFHFKLEEQKNLPEYNFVIHLDDWELREDVQREVSHVWEIINTENARELADIEGYWIDFYKIYGFNYLNYKI